MHIGIQYIQRSLGEVMHSDSPPEQRVRAQVESTLATFFQDSPWKIELRQFNNTPWFVYQRYDDSKPLGPLIHLAPLAAVQRVRSQNIASELLLIPAGHRSSQSVIDVRDDVLKADSNFALCEFPSYIAVPQRPVRIDSQVTQDMVRYQLTPVGVTAEATRYHDILTAPDAKGLAQPGLLHAVRVDCSKPADPPTKATKPLLYAAHPCAIYDTSASMGSINMATQHRQMAQQLSPTITRMINQLRRRLPWHFSDQQVDTQLDMLRTSLDVYVGNAHSGLQKHRVPLPAVFLRQSSSAQTREHALYQALESAFNAPRLYDARTHRGGNVPDTALSNTISQCGKNFVLLTDGYRALAPAVQSLRILFPGPQGSLRKRTQVLSHHEDAHQLALALGLPHFITLALVDGPLMDTKESAAVAKQNAGRTAITPQQWLAMQGDEVAAFHALPHLLGTTPQARAPLYDALATLVQGRTADEHMRRRATAMLTVWAMRGDQDAARALWQCYYSTAQDIPLSARLYVAKSCALIITEAQRSELLQRIRENPSAAQSMQHLVALAGHGAFVQALQYIVRHGWGRRVILNDFGVTLRTALHIVFQDPIVQAHRDIKTLPMEQLRTLAGITWHVRDLQDTLRIFNTLSIPSLMPLLQRTAPALAHYALATQRPPWKAAARIQYNPLPAFRHHYRMTPQQRKSQLLELAKNARHEESWISFERRERAFVFESGLLATDGSVLIQGDWPFYAKHMANDQAFQSDDGSLASRMYIRDHHIHPWHNLSEPKAMSALPSVTDLANGWMVFLYEARKRYPQAQYSFHIYSPLGHTQVRPTRDLLDIVDAAIRQDSTPQLPHDAIAALEDYQHYAFAKRAYVRKDYIRKLLQQYWDISFPDHQELR